MQTNITLPELRVGWKEWVSLPDLNIPAIKAKVDTGARTSALHAFQISAVKKSSGHWVRYVVKPLRKNPEIEVPCESRLLERRDIKDSGGHVESRYVIETTVVMGAMTWSVALSLTNREDMLFRMLLGRTALSHNMIIYPHKKYLTGKAKLKTCYPELRKGQQP
jgi:hypothetical protein